MASAQPVSYKYMIPQGIDIEKIRLFLFSDKNQFCRHRRQAHHHYSMATISILLSNISHCASSSFIMYLFVSIYNDRNVQADER